MAQLAHSLQTYHWFPIEWFVKHAKSRQEEENKGEEVESDIGQSQVLGEEISIVDIEDVADKSVPNVRDLRCNVDKGPVPVFVAIVE